MPNATILKLRERLEALLWSARWLVVIAVLASVVIAAAMVVMSTKDAAHVLVGVWKYKSGHAAQRATLVAGVVEVVDGYLLAAIMLIFSMGLYSIFIGTISAIPKSKAAALVIHTLEDLKNRLAKTILLILFVKFFEVAMKLQATVAIDLVWLGLGTVLVAAALLLSHLSEHPPPVLQLPGTRGAKKPGE